VETALAQQLVVGAAFDDSALVHDEDLVGGLDGGEAVRDHEGGAAAAEVLESVPDEGLALGVEAGGGLVEDEDARIGDDGARDGDALALAAGELDAALADDGVVAVVEALDELVAVRDAGGGADLFEGGAGACERDVLADGAVEEEVVLEDDAELGAVVLEPDGGEVLAVDEDAARERAVEGHDEVDERALPRPTGPDERGGGAGGRVEGDILEDGHAGRVLEADVLEDDVAHHLAERLAVRVVVGLGGHAADLTDAVEARERLADLRADAGDLDEGRRHDADEEQVGDEVSERHGAGEDGAAADEDDEDADGADDEDGDGVDRGGAGDAAGDVAEEAVHALGEDALLAALGRVDLDDAVAAERLGEAAGDLGGDLASLAEDRPEAVEPVHEHAGEGEQHGEREHRELPVEIEEDAEREDGGDHAADELDDAGADEVADALGVGHDAGDEDAGLGRVVVADGQAEHVGLDGAPHVGDGALARDADDLREREAGRGLDERGEGDDERERHEQVGAILPEHGVDRELRAGRQHQAGQPVHDHEGEADGQRAAVGGQELTRLPPDAGEAELLPLPRRGLVGHGFRLPGRRR